MGLRETSGAAEKQTGERIGESRLRDATGEPGGDAGRAQALRSACTTGKAEA